MSHILQIDSSCKSLVRGIPAGQAVTFNLTVPRILAMWTRIWF